jgi:hypothetical protein
MPGKASRIATFAALVLFGAVLAARGLTDSGAKAAQGSRFDFAYDGGTNIDPKGDRHMHSASLALLGADEIRTEWTELAEGKPVLVVKSHLVRKAR